MLQYTADAGPQVAPVYAQFLSALPPDVEVVLVCPSAEAVEDFRRRVGPVAQPIQPVVTGHVITSWSRDRWVGLIDATGHPVLWHPCEESGAAAWPARAGDHRVTADLAGALPNLAVRESPLAFDGGDFVADDEWVVVSPRVAERNLPERATDAEDLRQRLARVLGRRVLLLSDGPDHHAGMVVMLAGDGRALVADPAAGIAIWDQQARTDDPLAAAGGIDRRPETIETFQSVARQLADAGLSVTRVPVLPGMDGRAYVTFTNGILDQREGRRVVYMPTYAFDGSEPLNAAGRSAWEALGYEVRPIDCTNVYLSGGTLRCLVHVLERR